MINAWRILESVVSGFQLANSKLIFPPIQHASFLLFPINVFPNLFPFLLPSIDSYLAFSCCLLNSHKLYPHGSCTCSMWMSCREKVGWGTLHGWRSHCSLVSSFPPGPAMSLAFITDANDDSDSNGGRHGLFICFTCFCYFSFASTVYLALC